MTQEMTEARNILAPQLDIAKNRNYEINKCTGTRIPYTLPHISHIFGLLILAVCMSAIRRSIQSNPAIVVSRLLSGSSG